MKKTLLAISLLAVGLIGPIMPGLVFATDPFCSSNASADAKEAAGCMTTSGNVENKVVNVINIFLYVVGFVAVVMIIYGGFLYMTSQGDAGKVQKAKNTILYSVIGLAIAVLAYVIVGIVLTNVK